MAAAVMGLTIFLAQGQLLPPSKPVILSSHVLPSGGMGREGRPIASLLALHGRLHLSGPQQEQLQALSDAEDKAMGPIIAQTRRDQEQFGRFVQGAKTHGGASLSELQRQAAAAGVDSNTLRQIRQQYWSKAMSLLTPSQNGEVAMSFGERE